MSRQTASGPEGGILDRYRVRRWTTSSLRVLALTGVCLPLVALAPFVVGVDGLHRASDLIILIIMAAMWNALVGYAGLVSVGQQAFIGLGAYATVFLARHGTPPFAAIVLAGLVCAAAAVPISLVVLRLRGGQFAIGTWVVAETLLLLVSLDSALGGGTGISFLELGAYPQGLRQAYVYWTALGLGIVLLAMTIALLRSPAGTGLSAIRDDEEGAAAVGVSVMRSKRLVYVLAGLGCGWAGALTVATTLFIQPSSIFGVQWSAFMIFMVLVGGIGTLEGPAVGAVVFFLLQLQFADGGAWYLIGLGALAVVMAVLVPRGLWGSVADRIETRVVPLGYAVSPVAPVTPDPGDGALGR